MAFVFIRPSSPEDAEAIALVQVRSFQTGLAGLRPKEALAALDPEPRVPLWRERQALVAVDEPDSAIIGVAQFGPSDEQGVGEIYRFFVHPERWGQGVGQRLMLSALEQFRVTGFVEGLLWVDADNRRARRF